MEEEKRKYKLLGESGLVEDEDGNIISASEIDDEEDETEEEQASEGKPTPLFDAFKKNSFVSSLDDKTNPAHWYYDYDPRYCGPSREEYMERMARRYRESNTESKEEVKEEPYRTPQSAKDRADREQGEVIREGLHPRISQHINGPSYAGIVNRQGEMVITTKNYYPILGFSNGLAIARSRKTKKFGFLNRHGEEEIPCTWRSVGPFSEYMAAVVNDEKMCGYIDVTGRMVIPCQYREGWPFHDGLARVQKDNHIGMIDVRGNEVIPIQWTAMGDFSDGLAGVRDESGKLGFIDKTGNVVIPCQWKEVWPFCEGRAVVQDFNKRLGFIDTSGKLVIPCRWKKVSFFQNGMARVSDSRDFLLRRKWLYLDKDGRVVEPPRE